ncbi:DNA repair protein RecO (recombination protein O) [Altererythrobacter atlanticus]|uniref:DNA repair protein RecO n=1 Tax=Croceibacterium atlanticum TaxID=1267766 RepID=A0A0F7KRI4_9SPHN|nr:recombination protein O N-terminal domain-containing protein [Croceibacterium atlanticum]AKH42214.1 DNA repair protein RecO [Croceibacterium atlanticum]MBB5733974.1 DNA repair protein RecO (recombination protein O) [Croceibacterium atlanticum]
MQIRAPAILIAARAHGETAVIARLLTEEFGMVAAYVAGGRGRRLRPVVIPGNLVELQLSARSESQLPFAKLELLESRGPFLSEPLAAAAIGWACALTATALPERQPYPPLYDALGALLGAICHAPSARGWAGAMVAYESLLLRELGYGGTGQRPQGELPEILAAMDRLAPALDHYLLADRRGDVMAARSRLRDLLERILR